MRGKEHGNLVEYFDRPRRNGSLLERVMGGQLEFDTSLLPDEVFSQAIGIANGTVLKIPILTPQDVFPQARSNLWVLRDELRKPSAGPEYIDQLVSLYPKDHSLGVDFLYRYMGPKGDCPGLLQHLSLRMTCGTNSMIDGFGLTREVIDNVGDLCFAKVGLLPEVERGIKQYLGLPLDWFVGLTLVPDHVLVMLGTLVVAELEESDLQKLGMNACLEDNEDKIVAKITAGKLGFVLTMGKKLKPNYPGIMIRGLREGFRNMITPCDLCWGLIDEMDLN